MWFFGRNARRRRILRHSRIDSADWQRLLGYDPMFAGLTDDERRRLHDLTVIFLHEVTIEGCGGLELDQEMRRFIAAQACLPILELGLGAYRNVSTLLVYPEGYRTRLHSEDEHGIVDTGGDHLGEAWYDGPVILNWADAAEPGVEGDPFNLVIHEFAHQIDMLSGYEDGTPPLHRGMDREAWQRDFAQAREELAAHESAGEDTLVDPYAAEDEVEGFAVFSETFFSSPQGLRRDFPAIYSWLRAFYLQDPAAR